VFVALVVVFYAEEDWRGRRDWNRYGQAMAARGVSVDFRDYIPKPVPAEENFAEAPIVKSWCLTFGSGFLTNDLYTRATFNISTTNIADKGHRHFVDLVAWQMASVALQSGPLGDKQQFETDQGSLAARAAAAPAVLEGMKPDEADFAAIRLASARTNSRFPIQYDQEDPSRILLPHLANIKSVCARLNLQACAELAAGQPDKALADEKLMLYLADSIKTEPMLISYLVRVACLQIAVQPVWEGLAERRWTDSQLQELEQSFQHYDFPADFDHAFQGEKTYMIRELDYVKKKGLAFMDSVGRAKLDFSTYSDFLDSVKPALHQASVNAVGRIAPAGWYDFERLNYCVLFDAQTKGVVDAAAARFFPGQVASNHAEVAGQLRHEEWPTPLKFIVYHQAMASLLFDYGKSLPMRAAVLQTCANQAAIACALERYRLANGQFPETLGALTPRFISRLPNDVIGGQPYKYRRTADGQFILYSVGWNEKDDGGAPGKKLFDEEEGDWVWDYPARQ
jgi:hypothetical protein